MINSLRLLNFKAFENQLIEFRGLTLLSGFNNTGKSSILQALLLLRQSYQHGMLQKDSLALNGDLVNIGTASDALCERAKEDYVGFEISTNSNGKGIWNFSSESANQEANVINITSKLVNDDIYQSSLFNDYFHYFYGERIGVLEKTAYLLFKHGNKPITIPKLSHSKAKSINLIDQVEAWMGEINPGIHIKVDSNPDTESLSLEYYYGDSNSPKRSSVGLGITYALPIVVAVLASQPGTLILIEHPEVFLHASFQAKISGLFALAANYGVQLIIETHSDHVLNGIRVAVHSGKISHEDIQLLHFQHKSKQNQDVIEVVSPRIDRNGRIDRWDDGFFDQWEETLIVLLEPAKP
ncbi:AAA family ATPase [Brunnivagina elsteri]|uniref:ABC transporter permease n=1 Tax=Brunnivagina elsteri CCALA 953 TaxID=987040 RepID=A0A2A2TMQ7_9CYAN|nr:DUF3696 domain-containing protein [Calothrix elsteri]PAX59801.1 ABC transporter permease [Calothrix elsteri CCALA 953]